MRRLTVEAEPAFRTARANPYNALLARALVERGVRVRDLSWLRLLFTRIDVVHLHWPDLTFLSGTRSWRIVARLSLFTVILGISRARGTRLFWTVHNVEAHEERATPRLRAAHRRMLVRNVDGVLALSHASLVSARIAYPELHAVPAFVTPHGHYRGEYDFSGSRDDARRGLGLGAETSVVLTIGQIRPYKNIPRLIEVFGQIDDPSARLVVAGRPSSAALAAELQRRAASDARVVLDLEFQTEQRIATWLRAADLVVLPYRAVLNSGSAILALSADRPVLAPALGSLVELADAVGSDWLRTYDGDLDEAVLTDAVRWARTAPPLGGVDLSSFDWETVAQRTVDAYRVVVGHVRIPARNRSAPHRSGIAPDLASSAPR
jgi:glycosyltransferase involved in cell wall biosynthesis